MTKIAIIGGGVAGISAAARLIDARPEWSISLFEASDRLGGRARTDAHSLPGFAFDQGALYLQDSRINPLTQIAADLGFSTTEVPEGNDWLRCQTLNGWINLPVTEPSVQLTIEQIRANFEVAGAMSGDPLHPRFPNATVTPKPELSTWGLEFGYGISEYGAFSESAETWQYLAADSARQITPEDGGPNLYVDQGIGTLVEHWGAQVLGQRATLQSRVVALDFNQDVVTVHWIDPEEVAQSEVFNACIVTLPVAVLARGDVQFRPKLPGSHSEALQALRLGSYKKLALGVADVPEGLLVGDNHYLLQADPKGVWQCFRMPRHENVLVVHAAGDFAAQLDQLEDEAVFAMCTKRLEQAWPGLQWLPGQRAITRWNDDPRALGAYSYTRPAPGADTEDAQALGARTALREPVGCLQLVGEATYTEAYGTLQAAFHEGARAADVLVKRLG